MPRNDDQVYADLMAKLSAAADDRTDKTVATLDGLEAFVLRQIVQQRDYLREERLGLAAAIDRRDRDNDALRDALLRATMLAAHAQELGAAPPPDAQPQPQEEA